MRQKQRFEKKYTSKGKECWLWHGAINSSGYGCFWLKAEGKLTGAHRAAWMIYRGAIPEQSQVLHKCDNRLCVNPRHLFLGTNGDNVLDRVSKGRTITGNMLKTLCARGHLLGNPDIRRRRVCGICRRKRDKVRYRTQHPVKPPRTHCSKGHLLEGNVYISRLGHKRCRICKLNQPVHG